MKIHLLIFSLLTFFVNEVFSQTDGSVKAVVIDSTSSAPLQGASITVLQAADSSLVSFARTSSSGAFFINHLSAGQYRLLVTHTGYHHLSHQFTLSAAMPFIDFGSIVMADLHTLLAEVTVVQEKPPVIIRSDTTEYNAGSFKTKPNAVVEELLKKLPGIQVDKDGKIKSNGEEIKRVLVDGKEFFGNDPTLATRNLPADAIDKVQVFERKSEQSRFTGFDDGNSEKTINLTVRPDKKNGVFGKATAGAGDKGLYQGNFNINAFNGDRQLSAIGMLNNTNKQGFSILDILNFNGGLPGSGKGGGNLQIDKAATGLPMEEGYAAGITTTWAGGVNYSNSWQKRLDMMNSYFYNHQQTIKDEHINQQWLLPGSQFTTTKQNNSTNSNDNNRVNVTGDYKIDSSNSLRVTSSLNYQQSAYGIRSVYGSVADSGSLLNDGAANSYFRGNGYSWKSNAIFRHRFSKKGRTFSASITANFNNNSSQGNLQSHNNFYSAAAQLQQTDTIDQINSQASNAKTYGIVLSYTEPLSRKSLLEFNYNVNTTLNVARKVTFDFDGLAARYSRLNDLLSNEFRSNYTFHRPALNWRYQQKKVSVAFGLGAEYASLDSRFHLLSKDTSFNRPFTNLLPLTNLQYNISQYQHLRFQYKTATRAPSVAQLQPIPDNSDPLNIKIGNPALKQEYNHRFQANYLSFDPYRHTSFFGSLNAGITNHEIVNADQVGSQGRRITQPVNVNGSFNLTLNSAWGFPLKHFKGLYGIYGK